VLSGEGGSVGGDWRPEGRMLTSNCLGRLFNSYADKNNQSLHCLVLACMKGRERQGPACVEKRNMISTSVPIYKFVYMQEDS